MASLVHPWHIDSLSQFPIYFWPCYYGMQCVLLGIAPPLPPYLLTPLLFLRPIYRYLYIFQSSNFTFGALLIESVDWLWCSCEALDWLSLVNFAQIGNVYHLNHQPSLLGEVWTNQTMVRWWHPQWTVDRSAIRNTAPESYG